MRECIGREEAAKIADDSFKEMSMLILARRETDAGNGGLYIHHALKS